MIYSEKEILTVLEESNIILKVPTGYILNMKAKAIAKSTRAGSYCINYPEAFQGLGDAVIYKKIMEECSIPLMYKKDISYFLRTQTAGSVKGVKELLKRPELDYTVFIQKTKNFYRSDIALPGFANYIIKGTWEIVYDDTTAAQDNRRSTKGVI